MNRLSEQFHNNESLNTIIGLTKEQSELKKDELDNLKIKLGKHIFSFLTNPKDVCSASLVCKNWHNRTAKISFDFDHMLKLIETRAQAILFADQTLKTNSLFISQAIGCNLDTLKHYSEALKFASPEIQKNKDAVLTAIQHDGFAIEFAPELQSEKEVALAAVRKNGRAAFFIGDELQNDREIMLEAWNQNKRAIRSTSLELRSDKDFMLNIARQDGYLALQYACDSLLNDKEFILIALSQNKEAREFVPKKFLNDPDIIAVLETASLNPVEQSVKPSRFKKMLDQWDIKIRNVKHEYLPFDRSYCRDTWIRCIANTSLPIRGKQGEFIHANTVNLPGKVCSIATIYPLIKEFFWSACMSQANVIVDLTNDKDIKRNKLEIYYPVDINQTIQYGSITITCLKVEKLTAEIVKYQCKVTDLDSDQAVIVDRIHYLNWEDACGTNARHLLDVVHAMEPYENQNKVPFVHCVGGMGRSGTLLTVASLKKLIEQGIVTPENLEDYMESIIFEGRLQRSLEFIQTDTQIETIWEFANNCFKMKESNLI